jgi:autotransporter family porin
MRRQAKIAVPILLLSMALVFTFCVNTVSAADGDVIYVNGSSGSDDNDGYSPLTAKLSIGNATGSVNANGTVSIADGLYTGIGNTNITINKNMNIIGQSQTGTIINGTDVNWIFSIEGAVTVTIQNITFANGIKDKGAAICNEGNLTLNNCTFIGNTANNGGAIYSYNSLTVTGSTFTGNSANIFGGAIYNGYNSALTGCTFTGNSAHNCGGAILNDYDLTLTGCTFIDNSADYMGGAIYSYNPLTLTGCTFTGNSAYNYGGAILNDGTLTVINSTFTSNSANYGGAIYNYGILNVLGSTFADNIAGNGGAIFNEETLTITNSNFTHNTALSGGAIQNVDTSTVSGSNFTDNTAYYNGGAIYNSWDLTVNSSNFTGNNADDEGGAIYNNGGTATVNFNRITGNTASQGYDIYCNSGSVDAEYNWWGSNNPDFASLISGDVDYTPWLSMAIAADPTTIGNGETSLITVSFNNQFDGTTVAPFDPATGHIPDGTPVTFNTDLGSIGCKTIDEKTSGGVATATLAADETVGTAHVNAVNDAQTVNTEVIINAKSGLYLTVTPSKTNPVAGDTVVYTLKVGNNGPDTAKDVVMTYVVPEGLEFVGANVDMGECEYDSATRTITWTIGDVPKGDPFMWLSLRVLQAGGYLIDPVLSTSTYDPTLETGSLSVNAVNPVNPAPVNTPGSTNPSGSSTNTTQVNASSSTIKTVGMQDTGLPIAGLILAVLMLFGGLVTSKK